MQVQSVPEEWTEPEWTVVDQSLQLMAGLMEHGVSTYGLSGISSMPEHADQRATSNETKHSSGRQCCL